MPDLSASTLRDIHCVADILRGSKKAVILTGAGISTPSGIPDFRSTGSGLWERYDPYEVASLTSFRTHPEKFFGWLQTLGKGMQLAQPNPAHFGLARLEQAGYFKTIITQNIDGLHQRAGARHVLEVHGSMATLTCGSCYRQYPAAGYFDKFLDEGEIPHCPECGNILKPDAVLFGEQLPAQTWLQAQQASKACDLMMVAGSSLEVLPVASLPMRAFDNGAHLILINHSQTYIDVRADFIIKEDVVDIIPLLAKEILGE
jgi:NAD-dependent deacetylase